MPETRGYASINDRTNGWGPGVDPDAQPTVDAPFEPPRDDAAQPTDRSDVYDADGNVVLGANDDVEMTGAQRRWTRELEQRFSRRAQYNPDIEDRARVDAEGNVVIGEDDLRGEGDVALSKSTEIHAGKQDAYDEDSYSARIFNRPTHHGDIHQLEGDFFLPYEGEADGDYQARRELQTAHWVYKQNDDDARYTWDADGRAAVNQNGEQVAVTVDPNADNRDRLSGWGISDGFDRNGNPIEHPGAGAWNQGAGQVRPLDGVTYFPDTEFADAELPNANTEHESDYIHPDDGPEGTLPPGETAE